MKKMFTHSDVYDPERGHPVMLPNEVSSVIKRINGMNNI